MINDHEIRIDVGRCQDGTFVRVIHLPSGISETQNGLQNKVVEEVKDALRQRVEAAVRDQEKETVYLELFGEGTRVFRPVLAERLPDGTFRILEENHVPEGEKWAFYPGSTVECTTQRLSNEWALVVESYMGPKG